MRKVIPASSLLPALVLLLFGCASDQGRALTNTFFEYLKARR
jgi:hypothetical protein